MIRAFGSPRPKLSFTQAELEELAQEFAEYAAEDIADLLGLAANDSALGEVALEIAHAIRSAIDELPHERLSPAVGIRQAAAEAFTSRSLSNLALARGGMAQLDTASSPNENDQLRDVAQYSAS
jgi:hypothetical protein